MNPLPLPKQLLGLSFFNIAQFLNLVDHATWETRNLKIWIFFYQVFGSQFVLPKKLDRLKVLEVPTKNLRSSNPRASLRRSLRRKWYATGNASCVPKCVGWIGASGGSGRFPMGCLGGIPVWEGHGRRVPKSGPLVGEV